MRLIRDWLGTKLLQNTFSVQIAGDKINHSLMGKKNLNLSIEVQ